MNGAHLHLLLNHVPVIGVPIGLLLLVFAFLRRSEEWKRAALWTFVFIALMTIPTYLTGPQAEHYMKSQSAASPNRPANPPSSQPRRPGGGRIHAHEESAVPSLVVTELLGLISVAGLVAGRRRPTLPGWSTGLALVVGLASTVLLARTANLGGLIKHPEIQENATAADSGSSRPGG